MHAKACLASLKTQEIPHFFLAANLSEPFAPKKNCHNFKDGGNHPPSYICLKNNKYLL